MRESELTTFLVRSLQGGGVKKLMNLNSSQEVQLHREVGNSAYIADICISSTPQNKKRFDNQKVRFVAIEVKISDWENGLYQAWRYHGFAEKSFLAIYKPFADKVKMKECINNNVGLIIFDEKDFKVAYSPKTSRFRKDTYEAKVREKIWSNLPNTQYVCPA